TRHEQLAATADWRISEGVAGAAHPANVVAAFNRLANATETFFLYRQKKIARVLPAAQSSGGDRCNVESTLDREPRFHGRVVNGAEKNMRVDRPFRRGLGTSLPAVRAQLDDFVIPKRAQLVIGHSVQRHLGVFGES